MRGGVVSVKAGASFRPGTNPPLSEARTGEDAGREDREGGDIPLPLLTGLHRPVKA
ncbi:hypothetical protein GCM10009076_26000 [Erythrobacter ramosus]